MSPFVQHHAADQLHVEMALAERALGGFAHGGEGFGEQIVELGALLEALAEVNGPSAQGLVRESRGVRLQRIDLDDEGSVFLQFPVIG